MLIMNIFISSAVVIVLISSTAAWNYIIKRNSTYKLQNNVVESIDKFNISECSGSDDICAKFGGQKLQEKCQCTCRQDKSTFGFYSNKWGCTDNSIVRQHAACRYALERPGSKGDRDPLFTLPVLGSHQDNNYVGNVPRKNCTVIAANATFLECDGTWGKLTESAVKRKLAFQDHAPGLVYVGPYQPLSPADPSLDGQVIRIAIQCEGLTWNPSQCVTFKIKGQLTCNSSRDIPITLTDEPTKIPTPSIPTSGAKIKKSDDDDPTPAAALIAGSVVGVVIFVVFVVVIITLAICLRREKTKANEKNNEGREAAAERTEASEHQVDDLIIAPYAQFSGEGLQPIVSDNQQSTCARDVEPYYLSLREPTVTGQEILETRNDRETDPDYQYPRVEMRTCQAGPLERDAKTVCTSLKLEDKTREIQSSENSNRYCFVLQTELLIPMTDKRKRGSDLENVPDYQYPRLTDNRMGESNRGTEHDYQYPRADNRMGESNRGTEPDYQYPRADPNHVNHSDTNSNDSSYEIMNPLYQNIGNGKEFDPP